MNLISQVRAIQVQRADRPVAAAAKDDRARYDEATNKALADLSTT